LHACRTVARVSFFASASESAASASAASADMVCSSSGQAESTTAAKPGEQKSLSRVAITGSRASAEHSQQKQTTGRGAINIGIGS
jgi:hypothetical protein